MAVSDWSTSASSNTAVGAVNIGEGCPAGNLNNAIREVMAQLRTVLTDASLDILGQSSVADIRAALGAAQGTDAVNAIAGLTPTADSMPYYTGASTAGLAVLSAFARSFLDDADAASGRTTLGAAGIPAISFNDPGYIRFAVPGGSLIFQIAFGTFSCSRGTTPISYAVPFPTRSFPIVSGSTSSTTEQDNWPSVRSATTSGFTAISAANSTANCWYIAVGY